MRSISKRHFALLTAACMIFALVVYPLTNPTIYYLQVLALLFMWSTLAASYNLMLGYTGYLSFGHSAFFGLGAYTAAILLRDYGLSPILTMTFSGLLSMGLAVIVGISTLRLRSAYFTIGTFVLSLALASVVSNLEIFGSGGSISLLSPFSPREFKTIIYITSLAILVVCTLTIYRVVKSRHGFALTCIRENEQAAQAFGINTRFYRVAALAISSFFPALVGAIYAYNVSFISPESVFSVSNDVMMCLSVLLGGAGTLIGPILGASVLQLMLMVLAIVFRAESYVRLLILGALTMMIVMVLHQKGILGHFEQIYERLKRETTKDKI